MSEKRQVHVYDIALCHIIPYVFSTSDSAAVSLHYDNCAALCLKGHKNMAYPWVNVLV